MDPPTAVRILTTASLILVQLAAGTVEIYNMTPAQANEGRLSQSRAPAMVAAKRYFWAVAALEELPIAVDKLKGPTPADPAAFADIAAAAAASAAARG